MFDQKGEFGVAVESPPVAAIERVARRGDLPAFELLERVGDGRGFGDVVGADGASGKRQEDQAPVRVSVRARTLACANALRVVPNRFDRNQHGPTQPLPQTRRYTPRNRTMPRQAPPAARSVSVKNPYVYAATPAPQAITLTMSMPDHPVNINSARPTAASPQLFRCAMCCIGRQSRRRPQRGWRLGSAGRNGAANVMCARSGQPMMMKCRRWRDPGDAFGRRRRARSRESRMPYTFTLTATIPASAGGNLPGLA